MDRIWSDQQFINAVHTQNTKADVLRSLNLSITTGNYRTFDAAVKRLCLKTDHFKGKSHGKSHSRKIPLDEILVNDSTYLHGCHLLKRLVKEGIFENKCSWCGLESVWNEKPITLQLDHINGDPSDNRIENLRILCPNCHSQTDTFSRR